MPPDRPVILIIDDDVLLCQGLARTLQFHGFDVQSVHSAADAIEFVRHHPVDLVLLDWLLPDQDGVALLQQMRARGLSVPVFMLTAENTLEGRVRALNRGADDYVVKPFEADELLARIVAHVRRNSRFAEVSVGRITINSWKREVSVDGQRVDLTPGEYAILAHLMTRVEEVVPRQQLLEVTSDDKGTVRALDLRLMRLRRKLGVAAEQLDTVRGEGVRLLVAPTKH